MDQVRNGSRVSDLIPVSISSQQEAAAAAVSLSSCLETSACSVDETASNYRPPLQLPVGTKESLLKARNTPSPIQASAGASAAEAQPIRTLHPAHSTVFDKAMERLTSIFPDCTR